MLFRKLLRLSIFLALEAAFPAPVFPAGPAAKTLPVASVQAPAAKADRKAALQAALDAAVQKSGIPGASLAVVFANGDTLAVASGLADVEAAQAMTTHHRLFTGSVGKTFAAAVALQLCAAGKINLDDRVDKYLGDQAWYARIPNARAITIRHLLEHATGIPEHVQKPALWQALRKDPDRAMPMTEALSYIFDEKPLFAPGEKFAYADTNFILLGLVIEKVTSQPFYAEASRRLLVPLGLRDVVPADRRSLPGLASGYSAIGEPFTSPGKVTQNGAYYINPQVEWTGGGYITTPTDLARWAKALYEGKAFPRAWVRRMVAPSSLPTDLPNGASYGLGAFVWTSLYGPAYGHSGFVPGYNTMMAYYPDHKTAVVLQCNTDNALRRLGANSVASIDAFLPLVMPSGKQDGAKHREESKQ